MSENNSLSVGYNNSLTTFQDNLSLNKNDKKVLSYGASKVGLNIYKKQGWLDYDYVRGFREGYAQVEKRYEEGGKWYSKMNYIDEEGNELLKDFVSHGYMFKDGIAKVEKGGACEPGNKNVQYNLINNKGEYLLNYRVDYIGNFAEGYACIEKDGKQNYIDYQGNFLFKERFDGYSKDFRESWRGRPNSVYVNMLQFSEGFAVVMKNNKWNYVDKQGNSLLKERSNLPLSGFSEGFGKLIFGSSLDIFHHKTNPFERFIDKNGNYVFSDSLKNLCNILAGPKNNLRDYTINCYPFYNGFAKIEINGKYNFINKKGEILFNDKNILDDYHVELYFDDSNCFLIRNKSGKVNVMNVEGKILLDDRYEIVLFRKNGFIVCKDKGKSDLRKKERYRHIGAMWNYVDKQGNFLFNERYEHIFIQFNNLVKITRADGKQNATDMSGSFVFDKWMNNVCLEDPLIRVENQCLSDCRGNKQALNSLTDMFGNVITDEKHLKKLGYKTSTYWMLYNKDGKILSKDIYDYIGTARGTGRFPVHKEGKGWNFIDKWGNLLF